MLIFKYYKYCYLASIIVRLSSKAILNDNYYWEYFFLTTLNLLIIP